MLWLYLKQRTVFRQGKFVAIFCAFISNCYFPLWPKFFWPKNLLTKIFSPKFFWQNFILTKKDFAQKYFWQKKFLTNIFFDKIVSLPNVFLTTIFCWQIFWHKFLLTKNSYFFFFKILIQILFWPKILFFYPTFFD